jgi:hypothetical protein
MISGYLVATRFEVLYQEALDYLQYYLSFDWTERADTFTSIEVHALPLVPGTEWPANHTNPL